MTVADAFAAWWQSFPKRFGHQKNHCQVGWLAAWKARGEQDAQIAEDFLVEGIHAPHWTITRRPKRIGPAIAAAIRAAGGADG